MNRYRLTNLICSGFRNLHSINRKFSSNIAIILAYSLVLLPSCQHGEHKSSVKEAPTSLSAFENVMTTAHPESRESARKVIETFKEFGFFNGRQAFISLCVRWSGVCLGK